MNYLLDFITWLRKPCSVMKVVCVLLAFWCLVSGMAAYIKDIQLEALEAKIIVVESQCTTDKDRLQSDVNARDATISSIRSALDEEQRKIDAMRARAQAEQAKAERQKQQADAESKAWEAKYSNAPQSCTDALKSLDDVCSGLGDY